MALIGGGGAGNVAGGSNPSGAGTSLNYVGDHCYANSGAVIITNAADATLLEFSIGSSYILGTFAFGMNHADVSSSKAFGYKLSVNGVLIFENSTTSGPTNDLIYTGGAIVQDILLPPQSTIKFEGTTTDGSNITCYGMLTGRVYG